MYTVILQTTKAFDYTGIWNGPAEILTKCGENVHNIPTELYYRCCASVIRANDFNYLSADARDCGCQAMADFITALGGDPNVDM